MSNAVELMLHATGATGTSAVTREQRNSFCAQVGSADDRVWRVLCDLGLARSGRLINDGQDRYFHVTPLGYEFLAIRSRDAGGREARR